MAVKKQEPENNLIFQKAQIMKMKRFLNRIDLLSVLLNPDKGYTIDEVDYILNEFLRGEVR